MGELVAIKGTSDGLVVSLGDGPMQSILEELEARLASRASFFLGGRVALQVGDRPLSVEQIQTIGSLLERNGVTLWAVEGRHPATHVAAADLGLERSIRLPTATPTQRRRTAEPAGVVEQIPRDELTGLVVRRTLRSGQAIRHAGHVTLIGDLNPGAEIVAAGDIIVWGRLSGTAHAGATGDESAVIGALQLAPSQLRIATHIARSPDRASVSRPPAVPEIALVREGRIVVDRWHEDWMPESGTTDRRRRRLGLGRWKPDVKALFRRRTRF